jgi:hypothetical protein
MANIRKLEEILKSLRSQKKAWNAECIDDPEDMMNELPEYFEWVVEAMEEALSDSE